MDLRKIDKLIAEYVMGYKNVQSVNYSCEGNPKAINLANPKGLAYYGRYSSDISAAWEVIELYTDTIFSVTYHADDEIYECKIWDNNRCTSYTYGYAETAPLAICLAALKLKGVTYEKEV